MCKFVFQKNRQCYPSGAVGQLEVAKTQWPLWRSTIFRLLSFLLIMRITFSSCQCALHHNNHLLLSPSHSHSSLHVHKSSKYINTFLLRWCKSPYVSQHFLVSLLTKFNCFLNLSTMRLFLLTFAFLVLATTFLVTECCVYNSECNKQSRCVSGVCVPEECRVNIDCISKGLYFKCKDSRCVTDKHKLCRSSADCKNNVLKKKCQNYKCS